MTFPYQPGGDTPDYSGLFELSSGIRLVNVLDLAGNEPSFRPLTVPPITDTMPLRFSSVGTARGGSIVSTPQPDEYQFSVTGWFHVDAVEDVQAAIDYLHDHFRVADGWVTATLNAPGWTEARTMTVRKTGPTQVVPLDKGEMTVPERQFQLTMSASDPLKYSVTQTTTPVGTTTPVTNVGNAAASYLVRFDGPVTDHIQIDGAIGGGADRIRLNYALAPGEFAIINTRDGAVISNTGVDLYGDLAAIQPAARLLVPGSSVWTKSSGGGGTASILHYSAWE